LPCPKTRLGERRGGVDRQFFIKGSLALYKDPQAIFKDVPLSLDLATALPVS